MTVLQAMFLGVIQGITEFLPVSSSGHLSVFQNFFNMTTPEDGGMLFDVLLHLGTLVSVCLAYRRDLRTLISDCIAFFRAAGHPVPGGRQGRI